MRIRLTLDPQHRRVQQEPSSLIPSRPSDARPNLLQLPLHRQSPSKLHIVHPEHGRSRLLHLLDGLERLVVLPGFAAGEEGEDADLAIGKGKGREVSGCRGQG
jgi:hypothetical protein